MILGQLDAKMVPRWRQDGAKMALCWLMLALLGVILAHPGALGLHLVAKLSQDGAKMAQHSAKTSQRMRQHSAGPSGARPVPPFTQAQRTLLKDMLERTKRSSLNDSKEVSGCSF